MGNGLPSLPKSQPIPTKPSERRTYLLKAIDKLEHQYKTRKEIYIHLLDLQFEKKEIEFTYKDYYKRNVK